MLEGEFRYGTAFGGDKVVDFCQVCTDGVKFRWDVNQAPSRRRSSSTVTIITARTL